LPRRLACRKGILATTRFGGLVFSLFDPSA